MNTAAKSLDRHQFTYTKQAILLGGLMLGLLSWTTYAGLKNADITRWAIEHAEAIAYSLENDLTSSSAISLSAKDLWGSTGCWAIPGVFATCWSRRPGGAALSATMPAVGQVNLAGCYWGFTQRSQHFEPNVKWCEWTGF